MQYYTVKRRYGSGDTYTVAESDLLSKCNEVSFGGVHILDVVQNGPATMAPPADAPRAMSTWETQVSDDVARVRIEGQHAAIASAGIKVPTGQQAYATGTRMAQVGYDVQAGRKADFDRKQSVVVAAQALIDAVRSEGRQDRKVTARQIADSIQVNGTIRVLGGFALGDHAIRGLAARIGSPMSRYILGIRERMAERSAHAARCGIDSVRALADAANDDDRREIARVIQYECTQSTADAFVLRTRRAGLAGEPDVFACVSTDYVAADADGVVPELVAGLPRDAKAEWSYDPASTGWELRAEVWTATPVAEQAVGEAFRGYSSFQSRDNGSGAFGGGGGIELLRCLNASTYFASDSRARRVHRGTVRLDIRAMVRQSLKAIDALCAAWGTNRAREIAMPRTDDDRPVPISEAIPGFWRYMLQDRRSELAGVLPGGAKANAQALTRAFFGERRDPSRLVRSDFAQAWTRHIQSEPTDVRREAERAIGDWLVSGKPVHYLAPSA